MDFQHTILADYSALDALNGVAHKYHELGKHFFVTGLDKASHRLIRRGRNLGENIKHDADGDAKDEDELKEAEIEILDGDDVGSIPLFDYHNTHEDDDDREPERRELSVSRLESSM